MKADTERKRYHKEKLHKRKSRLHVHLSKDLRSKLKVKKRAILLRSGDRVRVVRGPGKGKEAKVADVNTVRRKVYVEGVASNTAKGREVPTPLEPSNLMLLSLEPTPERKKMFSEDAFKKKEAPKKPAPKKEAVKKEEKPPAKKEEKPAAKKEAPKETKPETAKPETKKEAPKPGTQDTKPATAPEAPKK